MTPVSNLRFLLGGLGAWPVLMGIATIDGIAREFALTPRLGARAALIISGVVMMIAIYVVAWLMLSWWGRPHADAYLWLVGGSWVILTIAFEAAILVLARGQPLAALLEGYSPARLADGNLILPGLILMLLAPMLVARLCTTSQVELEA